MSPFLELWYYNTRFFTGIQESDFMNISQSQRYIFVHVDHYSLAYCINNSFSFYPPCTKSGRSLHHDHFGRDRQLAEALSGRVVHSIRNRRERRVDDDLTDRLRAERAGILIAAIELDADASHIDARRDFVLEEGIFREDALFGLMGVPQSTQAA